jgi:hypothetical protein
MEVKTFQLWGESANRIRVPHPRASVLTQPHRKSCGRIGLGGWIDIHLLTAVVVGSLSCGRLISVSPL